MPLLRVYLFGGLDMAWDERPLPELPGGMARSLLAYLLAYHDRPHTRDLLAGTFWPDLPDAIARRRLSQALWQIRTFWRNQDVTHPLLLATAGTVQLHPALPVWLDVAEFGRHYERAAAGAPGELEAAARCVELYRGEFLAGHYEDWILLEREGLRGKLLQVLEQQLGRFKSRGEYERALVCARRLTAEDPWREEAHREIMRLCHLLGRDDEALRQYDACCQALARELGSPPSQETVALVEEVALRAGGPVPVLLPVRPRPPSAPRLERPDQLPLAGRQAELAELVRLVDSAALGNGGLAVVYGEAGVGKSRLLRELAANAQWRGVRVAWGHCCELAAPIAYQPLVEALRAELATLRTAALPSPWADELVRLLPELAAARTPLAPVRQEEAGRLLEALVQAFLALAAAGPLLLLLEDAHWMDPASFAALRYLLPRLAETPLLFVISVRPEELAGRPAAVLAAMESTRLPHSLSLQRLDPAEAAELVQRALDLPRPAPRFSARLHAETEGNPFFLVETLWALVQEGVLAQDPDGGWRTPWDDSTEDYAELPLPAGVAQSIAGRLERLPPALREPLDTAAVIGRVIDFPLWLAAGNRSEQALLAAGDELCRRGLLLAAAPGGGDYTFAHDLIRRVAYERLSAPRRRAGHRRAAEALALLAPEEPAALSYHWTHAEGWERAAFYHQRAGDRARSVYANAAAVAHYTQALDSLARLAGPDDPERRYELLLAREAVLNLLGERSAQLQDLQTLQELAASLDHGRQAEVALRRAGHGNATGDYPGAIAAAQDAVRLAQLAHDAGREASGGLCWGYALLNQGDFVASRTRLEAAVALAHRHDFPSVEAEGLRHLGSVHWCLGDYAQAGAHYEQSLRLCRATGERRSEGVTLNNLALVFLRQGDYAQARAYSEQALRLARELGDLRSEGKALSALANAALGTGEWERAQAHTEQALEIARRAGNRSGEGILLLYLGNISCWRGDYARAAAHDTQSLQLFVELGDRRLQGVSLNNLGEVSLHRGNYSRAREELERALAISGEMRDRQSEGPCLQDLGRLFHRLGAFARAATCYEQALQISRESGSADRECQVLAALGLLAYHRDDLVAAAESCQQALAVAERVGDLPTQALAWTCLAHTRAGRRAWEEAVVAYDRALTIRRQLKQPHLAAEPLAGLARCALAQGQPDRALQAVEEILAHLREKTLDGADEPLRVYLNCWQVLAAVQDPRAEAVLRAAYERLQEHAAQIEEKGLRHTFLERVPAHRQIAAAYHELRAAAPARQVTVSLPRYAAPSGRPLRPDEFVAVDWTVDAPEDTNLADKPARRRQRLLRLLTEAQSQGARPRGEDLAQVLEVGIATVRRDLAALRAAGRVPPRRRPGSAS